MKFNEMPYTRPDIDALLARCKELAARAAAAPDGDALVALYYEQSEAFAEYNTASQLANIHYTCDTRDAYWKAEQDFFDANGPAVTNASVEISRAFLANPHVDALTAKFGTTCVAGMKNAVLSMDDRTVELQQQFNALVSKYQQIYGGALGPYKEDLDPAVRRAAYEAEAGYFDAHRDELDALYGEIVKNLNAQAKVLGYKDYSELSYVRMNRIGYGPEEIKKFRDQVANDVVPLLQKVMAMRAKRTGIEHPTFTDLPIQAQPRLRSPHERRPHHVPRAEPGNGRVHRLYAGQRAVRCGEPPRQDVRRLYDQPAQLQGPLYLRQLEQHLRRCGCADPRVRPRL